MPLRPIQPAVSPRPASPAAAAARPRRAHAAAPSRSPAQPSPVPPAAAPAPPSGPRRTMVAVIRDLGDWLVSLWTTIAALWRGRPAPPAPATRAGREAIAPRSPQASTMPDSIIELTQFERPEHPEQAQPAPEQATPLLLTSTPLAAAPEQAVVPQTLHIELPAPPQRRYSCPPAIHYAAAATPSALSTPASESAPGTPPDFAPNNLDASYIVVDTPDAYHAPERASWWSYFHGARAPQFTPTQEAKLQPLALVGPEHVADLLRLQLLAADTHEHQGALSNDPNNLLAHSTPETLLGTDGRWLGLARQFPTDAHRQRVVTSNRDAQGGNHTAHLGTFTSKRSTSSHTQGSIDAMADHLLRICDGDIRWRFQLSQLLNQTLPNAVVHSMVTSGALSIGGTPGAMLGTSHESYFEVVRRSHKRLRINHTSIWRGEPGAQGADGLQALPFYIDADGTPHRFVGEARQMVQISLLRPRKPSAAPRLGRITLDVTGSLAAAD